jgi:hypothetical protein
VRFASFEEMENALRARLEALRRRAEPLHVLMLPDSAPPTGSASFWGYPQSGAFAELLIDCEEDRTLPSVVVGMVREVD